MAEALILDSEALNALAHRTERGVLAERARAILQVSLLHRAFVRVPAPVLAEVYRGPRFDVAIDRVLAGRGVLVAELTATIARRAGHILTRAKLSSAHAIDAFVVATAAAFSTSVIATGDVDDISRLAAPFKHVRVFGI
jgi:predicted nucleic acid-binding protein